MIIATMQIFADSGTINEIIEILSSVKGQTEGKSGCISCVIHRDINSGNRISYEERWVSLERLNGHIRSDLYRNILVAIDMSARSPVVKFETVADTAGMELIERTLDSGD